MKQAKDLFNTLTRNENNIFYGADRITKTQVNKAKKSDYLKDKVSLGFYWVLENQTSCTLMIRSRKLLLLHMFFVKDIDRSSTLYSFKGHFELMHINIADIKFLTKSAVNPKYCLLFVDLFILKICTYPMKSRSLLRKKIELFYNEIDKKRKMDDEMRM